MRRAFGRRSASGDDGRPIRLAGGGRVGYAWMRFLINIRNPGRAIRDVLEISRRFFSSAALRHHGGTRLTAATAVT